VSDDMRLTRQQANDDASISWWRWRPGIRPRSALLIGIPLIFLAFFFLLIGLYTLFFSSPGDPFGSLVLLLFGLALFPYPLLMTIWGWHDLWRPPDTMLARVLSLRASLQNRIARRESPALTPRIARAWYCAALAPVAASSKQAVMTFGLSEEQYKRLREGQLVQITYLPQLHYVLSIKTIETP